MTKRRRGKNRWQVIFMLAICVIAGMFSMSASNPAANVLFTVEQIAPYVGNSYTVVNGNVPYFEEQMFEMDPFEEYEPLDELGRATGAVAMIEASMFPTEPRGSIGMIRPSGWHTVRYDDLIEGKYLYNRCHLIAYMLTGQNDNQLNLITGTRYMNVEGMLPWEIKVHDHIEETGDRVLYRVTPVYDGHDLVAKGVLMEAQSLDGALSFCVFCYNIQPGIRIDYSDGCSERT